MEYLQYIMNRNTLIIKSGFKPYYKWNTFNTKCMDTAIEMNFLSFKPYYKWNTFNTTSCYRYQL